MKDIQRERERERERKRQTEKRRHRREEGGVGEVEGVRGEGERDVNKSSLLATSISVEYQKWLSKKKEKKVVIHLLHPSANYTNIQR